MSETHDTLSTQADLSVTKYVNYEDPSIVNLAKEIIKESKTNTPIEHAILIHDYVRDSILFGYSGRFWNQTASEVIRTGRGFCNTKSSLFAALLRAVGIPCRLQFVNISSQILDGIIDPKTPYVEHTYTEVFNSEKKRWCRVDSYIVDIALAEAAKKKLAQEDKVIGYGVHRDGQSVWNGTDDCFIQYVTNSELNEKLQRPLSTHTYGSYTDIGAFYAAAEQNAVKDIMTIRLLRWLFPLIVIPGNRAAQSLRKQK